MRRTFTRTPEACIQCRRRKTKCDGVRPSCKHCSKKRVPCTWATSLGTASTSPAGNLTPDASASATVAVGLAPGRSVPHSQSSLPPVPSPVAPARWGQDGIRICTEIFFQRHFNIDFCSFEQKPEFERKIEQSPFFSASIVALCGRYLSANDSQRMFNLESGEEVSRHGVQLARPLAKELSDEPSVTHIQNSLILAMAELLSDSGSRHWLFTGSAIRMAEIMRLNKEFHEKHSHQEQEIRRRTFWACLLFDRKLAYVLGKHRTINLETVSIAMPGLDASLAYGEATKGVMLPDLPSYQRPSELGILPYFIKTVCLWSDLAEFTAYSRRRLDPYLPTDSRSIFFIRHDALSVWVKSLPASLSWSVENYHNHTMLGQSKPYVSMQLLLHSATCAAHQSYLPHVTLYTRAVNLVDAAGWSYLHREESLMWSCVTGALRVGEVLTYLMDLGLSRSDLQTVWVAAAVLTAANTFLWIQYTPDESFQTDDLRQKGTYYFQAVQNLVQSWEPDWKVARQWSMALKIMHALYKAAYLGDVDEAILSGPSHEPDTDLNDKDFRPQPGDGYPTLLSLPNLQASLKFATSDMTARSINMQSVWLQLCSTWPYNFDDEGWLLEHELELQSA